MPIYEYECKKCKTRFEVLQGMTEGSDSVCCPKCSAEDVRRLLSMFGSKTSGASGISCDPGAFT